ncbi:hypothetical protein LR48_Vigan317s000900 [Vigna angularis]|uniref:Uncharacterized protein n=1 Tax=Phaseolus angularis TaxID=3914 RepID=A0A0L9T878_PHAAN|nr:hypothetical protein LR48_Vigan317s000900 [Vigna angularis]
MASSSSSKRSKKVARTARNTSPTGWISDDAAHNSDCYLELVEMFFNNLKVINGDIHSRVNGVEIIDIDDVWLLVTGLKAEGCMSHEQDFETNEIGKAILTFIGLKKTTDDWIFKDVQNPVRSLNNIEESSTSFTPKSEFERYIVEIFERTFKKIWKLENSLVQMENKVNKLIKNYVDSSSTEISDDTDDSSEEEFMDESNSR